MAPFWKDQIIRFGVWVKDIDRQYEQNNNQDLDNGVFNEFVNRTDSENWGEEVQHNASLQREDEAGWFNDIMMLMQVTEEDEEEKIKEEDDLVDVKDEILDKMEDRGYDGFYLRRVLEKNEHTYGTTGYALLDEGRAIRPNNIQI